MKTIYICWFIMAVAVNISDAQTSKGTKFLGLTLEIGAGRGETEGSYTGKYKGFSFAAAPQFSYFIADKWELGAGLGYSFSQTKYFDADDNSMGKGHSSEINPMLFVRRHLMLSEKVGFRTGPFASYSYVKSRYPDEASYSEDENIKVLSAGLNLGVEFFPVKRLGIVANLADVSYNYTKTTGSPAVSGKTKKINASLTNQLSLSVFYILGKK
ncbi:outer membrane beta-barrel protein [Arcticibacter tournemirensis]|uniref:PorT family protein n=1 Tax=Arcticibacter tournemirensis TaxID=699437 RepID=A0A4Q0MB11_9SPHI|nr:outer membrane beta-barrel protein [Arcticibacter tournemirensis]RXF70203.1 hypothetical protein EKH83_10025 [Arcticibacter tournemirensis]